MCVAKVNVAFGNYRRGDVVEVGADDPRLQALLGAGYLIPMQAVSLEEPEPEPEVVQPKKRQRRKAQVADGTSGDLPAAVDPGSAAGSDSASFTYVPADPDRS